MKDSIKICIGKHGFALRVNGMYIHTGWYKISEIKAIKSDFPLPNGTTEFISIKALKKFWNENRELILHATRKPYKSVWGNLELI